MKTEESSKQKLAKLMAQVQPVIDSNIADMDSKEIEFILNNYRKYLKIDLERDLEKARETGLKSSPLDDLFNSA